MKMRMSRANTPLSRAAMSLGHPAPPAVVKSCSSGLRHVRKQGQRAKVVRADWFALILEEGSSRVIATPNTSTFCGGI